MILLSCNQGKTKTAIFHTIIPHVLPHFITFHVITIGWFPRIAELPYDQENPPISETVPLSIAFLITVVNTTFIYILKKI